MDDPAGRPLAVSIFCLIDGQLQQVTAIRKVRTEEHIPGQVQKGTHSRFNKEQVDLAGVEHVPLKTEGMR
jgi:hypothetical protein